MVGECIGRASSKECLCVGVYVRDAKVRIEGGEGWTRSRVTMDDLMASAHKRNLGIHRTALAALPK
jgi:hypothetical protein